MEQKAKQLSVGFHREKITAPMGTHIPGYGHKKRDSDGIITDLYLYTVAFFDGENQALLFNVDALSITRSAYLKIRRILSEELGVNENNVYIAATHAHTAITVSDPDACKREADKIYQGRLQQIFLDSARFALEDLLPATILAARGEAKNTAFLRRYRKLGGTIHNWPKMGNPELVSFVGLHDDSVQLIRLVREGGKEILLVNFATHPDNIGGTKYCADFPGYTVDMIKDAFHHEVEAVFLNGAQGDSVGLSRFWNPEEYKKIAGIPNAKRIARAITGEVLKLYDWAKEIDSSGVEGHNETVLLEKNTFTEEELRLAKIVYPIYMEKGNDAPELREYYDVMDWSWSTRIMNSLEEPDLIEQQVSGLRVGGFLLVGIPGEPFSEIGIRIKQKSPFDMTFVTCCTNHRAGYFPSEAAYAVPNGYEKRASPFAKNCAQRMVDGAVAIMNYFKK